MPIAIGTLKNRTIFHSAFPSGEVPLVSVFPCRPADEGLMSFFVDGELLTSLQIEALSFIWMSQNRNKTYHDAYTLIRLGYPIPERFFAGAHSVINE
jgi:hypothetical protein